MKLKFKAIAMRCTEQQFNELKPRLDKYGLKINDSFFDLRRYLYLTNNYSNVKLGIGSTDNTLTYNRELEKTFNADLFLNCCGIETEPTYTLTKEQIIDNKDLTLKEIFKDVFNFELEVGKWYKNKDSEGCTYALFQGFDINTYGIAHFGDYVEEAQWFYKKNKMVYDNFGNNLEFLELANEEEVKNALVNYFESKNKPFKKYKYHFDGIFKGFLYGWNVSNDPVELFKNGKWATIIEQKEMTVAQIENELGYNIKIIK